VGNLLIPVQLACRRLYVARPFPWNWVVFFPIQLMFGVICAVAAVLFLQLTKIDPEPFSLLIPRIGYFVIVVAVVTNVVLFGVEELQRKLRERNQQLEQTVEKGTIALQQQEEELKRAGQIQQMLLPSTLPQLAGVQISGAWQPGVTTPKVQNRTIRLRCANLLPAAKQSQQPFATRNCWILTLCSPRCVNVRLRNAYDRQAKSPLTAFRPLDQSSHQNETFTAGRRMSWVSNWQ
jgi:hypothetical protein